MSNKIKGKVKIIRIIARLNVGGPATHAILLTEGLDKNKFDSLLITGVVDRREKDMLYLAKNKNVKPIIIPQLKRKINFIDDLVAFIKILRLIKREKPQIIHTHTAKAGALGRLAGILHNLTSGRSKCKLIHTFHGNVLHSYFGRLKSKMFILIERILTFFTDRIVVVSEALKIELLDLKIGPSQKLAVIPLGFEMEQFLSISSYNINSPLRIGIIARLVPVKNHRMFLEVAKLILTNQQLQFNKCKFILIGDGELREELEAYTFKLGIKENVEFWGWEPEIHKIYNSLDIVVLTSLNEGTPLSLIEAMAGAKPIIATDVGGVRDLFFKSKDYGIQTKGEIKIFDNGILCNPCDVKGMAEAIKILLDNSLLRKSMGDNGRAFVKERFSKERLVKDIELLYNNSLKR